MQAVVSSNGDVMWIPLMYTASHCPIDLTGFPYDTQVCKLKFGSWTYSGDEVGCHMEMFWESNGNWPHTLFT